ncbi:MAG: hypothetical protein IJK63_09475 [Oscillospiraceae bacterium]|nr:hypothetical protein [Oscillospiraceae bacterium]
MKTRETKTKAGKKTPAVSFDEGKKSNSMLGVLARECEEQKLQLLADICDLCHYPFILKDDGEKEEKCSECTISGDLEALLKKQRTVTTGEVMAIVAEEMHTVELAAGGTHDAGTALV